MFLYVETSAVLAWLFGEPRAAEVMETVNSSEGNLTSVLTILETERAIVRAVGASLITEAQGGKLRKLYKDNFRSWEFMEITEAVRDRAGKSFPVEPVRSLGALHLATALQFLELYDDLEILSFDKRILENLMPLGLSPA